MGRIKLLGKMVVMYATVAYSVVLLPRASKQHQPQVYAGRSYLTADWAAAKLNHPVAVHISHKGRATKGVAFMHKKGRHHISAPLSQFGLVPNMRRAVQTW